MLWLYVVIDRVHSSMYLSMSVPQQWEHCNVVLSSKCSCTQRYEGSSAKKEFALSDMKVRVWTRNSQTKTYGTHMEGIVCLYNAQLSCYICSLSKRNCHGIVKYKTVRTTLPYNK